MGSSFFSDLMQCLGAVPWGSVPWGSMATLGYDEYSTLTNHENELLCLKRDFDLIRATLEDSLKKNNDIDTLYDEVLLKRLRYVALEVENVLDEVSTAAKLQRLPKHIIKKVGDFFPVIINTVFFIHKVKKLNEKVDEIAKKFNGFEVKSISPGASHHEMPDRETVSFIANIAENKYRDVEIEKVINAICNKDIGKHKNGEIRVYGIWGMGGIGKTTLAQLVYNHEKVGQQFKLKRWVYVSRNFQVKETMKKIIESIDVKLASEHTQLQLMQGNLTTVLEGKKFLIVLDDVWIEDDKNEKNGWRDLMKILQCGAEGSVVLMTTRSEETSKMLTKAGDLQHGLQRLSEEDSCELFNMLAFAEGRKGVGIRELEPIGKEIVKRCQGLPLALDALGTLMWSKESREEWERVRDSITWNLQNEKVLPVLKLSYNNLLPHFKRCFAYCCLFPKGHAMKKDVVIQLWVANGFIPQRGEISLYVLAEEVFNCLVWRCFFQVVEGYINDRYKIHDLMYDMARHVMGDEYLVIEPPCKEITVSNHEVLHLSSSCPDFLVVTQCLKSLTSLRSIFMLVGFDSSHISKVLNHKYLRVLYLTQIQQSTLPKSISKLIYLRYLSLSNSSIQVLPESIIYLQNLQVLILSNCQCLYKLPHGLGYMTSLQQLDINGCDKLMHLPSGIKELTSLCTLSRFPVAKETGAKIGELGDLNLLEGELDIESLENVEGLSEAKSANLIDKTNISVLKLRWKEIVDKEINSNITANAEEVFEGIEPNPSLTNLEINHYMGNKLSPSWMANLRNLVKITFFGCRKCEHLPALGKIPNLMVITLKYMDSLKRFHDDDTTNIFFSLQKLSIVDCENLVSLPSNLPKLKAFELFGCNRLISQLDTKYKEGEGNDWRKFSHILNVRKTQKEEFKYKERMKNSLKDPQDNSFSFLEEFAKKLHIDYGNDPSNLVNILFPDTVPQTASSSANPAVSRDVDGAQDQVSETNQPEKSADAVTRYEDQKKGKDWLKVSHIPEAKGDSIIQDFGPDHGGRSRTVSDLKGYIKVDGELVQNMNSERQVDSYGSDGWVNKPPKKVMELFNKKDEKGQLKVIERLLGMAKIEKLHLEEALKMAIKKFPDSEDVKGYVSQYEDVYRVCLIFRGEGCSPNKKYYNGTRVEAEIDLEETDGEDVDFSSAEKNVETEVRDKEMNHGDVNKVIEELVTMYKNSRYHVGGSTSHIRHGDLTEMVQEVVVEILSSNDVQHSIEDKADVGSMKYNVRAEENGRNSKREVNEELFKTTNTNKIMVVEEVGPFTETAIPISDSLESQRTTLKTMIYESARKKISHFDLKKRFSGSENPSFRIGLTQMEDAEDETTPKVNRMARKPTFVCSPFCERAVNINKGVTREELKIWKYMFYGSVDETKESDGSYKVGEGRTFACPIFETDYFGSIKLQDFHSLATNAWIVNEVIDAFVMTLNHGEGKRSTGSPLRVFITTLFTDWIVRESTFSDSKMFSEHLKESVNGNECMYKLRDVDIVMFPILEEHHYYLVAFELKNPRISVIDNWANSRISILDDAVYANKSTTMKVKHVFLNYLNMVGHIKWEGLCEASPEIVKVDWGTTDNYNDCGVFLMRHMEMFFGIKGGKFECGFPREIQEKKRKLNNLRRKYLFSILTCEANKYRNKVIREAEELDKLDA